MARISIKDAQAAWDRLGDGSEAQTLLLEEFFGLPRRSYRSYTTASDAIERADLVTLCGTTDLGVAAAEYGAIGRVSADRKKWLTPAPNPAPPGLPKVGARVRARTRIHRPQGGPGYMPITILGGQEGDLVTVDHRTITVLFDEPQGNSIQWTGPDKLNQFHASVEVDGRAANAGAVDPQAALKQHLMAPGS